MVIPTSAARCNTSTFLFFFFITLMWRWRISWSRGRAELLETRSGNNNNNNTIRDGSPRSLLWRTFEIIMDFFIFFFIESSILCCHVYSSQCLAQLTPARVGVARSVHVQLGASTHVIRWDIVCLSPQSHTSVWESFHIFIMARQRPFCTLSRFKLLQVDQGSSVPLAKCSFGMIPLSRHSVDRSPRAFHSSTHNVVRASCFEVVRASVESRKLFLDGSLCLAGRWPWSGCFHHEERLTS